MRTAYISLWNHNHFKIRISEIEEGVSLIPIPIYEFIVKGDELKAVKGLFYELQVEIVDLNALKQKGYLANWIFAHSVFTPRQRDGDLVQQKFW
jgi:hypothetical protein